MGVKLAPGLIDVKQYLTIEALEDGLTASLSVSDCMYCVNGIGSWKSLPVGTSTIAINTGETLSFMATGLTPTSSNGIGTFSITKRCNLVGTVSSVAPLKEYGCKALFKNNTTIINVDKDFLFSDSRSHLYEEMFSGCTNLKQAPDIKPTSHQSYSLSKMFYNCTSLEVAPSVQVKALYSYTCMSMFEGCTNLKDISGVVLSATSLYSYCYEAMFKKCSNLTTSPKLPAIKTANSCYNEMFNGCAKLMSITAYFTGYPNGDFTYQWVDGIKTYGTFYQNKNANWDVYSINAIPSKWSKKKVEPV